MLLQLEHALAQPAEIVRRGLSTSVRICRRHRASARLEDLLQSLDRQHHSDATQHERAR